MEIRNATMDDLQAIAAVEAACFPAAEAATAEEFAGRLAHYAGHFWLLLEQGELVAFVDGFCTDMPDLTDEMYADAALHDEILDKTPDRIVRKRRNHTRTLAETSAEAARHIIFAAAFPCGKRPCGMNSSRTGIESEHYLSERENVVLALIGCFDFHFLVP